MKKYLLLLFGLSCLTYVYSQHIQPVNTLLVSHTHGQAITIDGFAFESCWPALTEIAAKYNTAGVSGDDDFSGYMGLCYDFTNLYVFVIVTDDIASPVNCGSSPWEYDNVEIFLDSDTSFEGSNIYSIYGDNAIQFRFNRGCEGNTNNTAVIRNNAVIESFIYDNTTDYSLEVAIPWVSILPEGSLPEDIMEWLEKSIGFDIQIADNDGSGRDGQFAWDGDSGSEDNAWYDTRTFGIIDFLLSDPDMAANAGEDQTAYNYETVTLDGTASVVPAEYTLFYQWEAPEGITLDEPSIATPSFVAPQYENDTTLSFVLVVNDGAFYSEPDTVAITILYTNTAPVADAGPDMSAMSGELVTLYGSGSYDLEGRPLNFAWTAPADITFSDPGDVTPSFIAPDVSTEELYEIYLVVNDGTLDSDPDTVNVMVSSNISDLEMPEFEIFSVYPNPVNSQIYIRLGKTDVRGLINVDITDVSGTLIYRKQFTQEEIGIDVSCIPNGLYIIQVTDVFNIPIGRKRFIILRD